jgi:predicted RNase H-like nuclease (RuvC/YqgF family)
MGKKPSPELNAAFDEFESIMCTLAASDKSAKRMGALKSASDAEQRLQLADQMTTQLQKQIDHLKEELEEGDQEIINLTTKMAVANIILHSQGIDVDLRDIDTLEDFVEAMMVNDLV